MPGVGAQAQTGAVASGLRATPGHVQVLYIGGYGRSGSTLLERILGQLSPFLSVGELIHLWSRGLGGQRCGCGAPFLECPFWTVVGERAFGGWSRVDAGEVLALQRSVDRTVRVPQIVGFRTSAFQSQLDRYLHLLTRLYLAIGEAGGGRTVIDSSKHPSLAFVLRRLSGVDLRVVQMVRSSHGAAYSYTKQVQRPEIVDRVEYMPTYSPLHSAVLWTTYNALFEVLGWLGTPRVVVQYERMTVRPGEELRKALVLVGEMKAEAELDQLLDGGVSLRPTHTVSGNPMRFEQGPVELRQDDEWRQRLTGRQRLTVSAASAPLLARFGYRLDGSSRTR